MRASQRTPCTVSGSDNVAPDRQASTGLPSTVALPMTPEEMTMIDGGLIAERLRVGTSLENLQLTIRPSARSAEAGPCTRRPASRRSGPSWTSKQTKPARTSSPGPSPPLSTTSQWPGTPTSVPRRDLRRVPRPDLPLPTGRSGLPGRGRSLRPPARHPRNAARLARLRLTGRRPKQPRVPPTQGLANARVAFRNRELLLPGW